MKIVSGYVKFKRIFAIFNLGLVIMYSLIMILNFTSPSRSTAFAIAMPISVIGLIAVCIIIGFIPLKTFPEKKMRAHGGIIIICIIYLFLAILSIAEGIYFGFLYSDPYSQNANLIAGFILTGLGTTLTLVAIIILVVLRVKRSKVLILFFDEKNPDKDKKPVRTYEDVAKPYMDYLKSKQEYKNYLAQKRAYKHKLRLYNNGMEYEKA